MKILNQVFRYCLISMIVTIFLNIILSDNISAKNKSDQNKSIESINSDSLSASDINSSTSRSIQNIIANKNGVVKVSPNNQKSGRVGREQFNSPELNIRGGRPSSHSIFLNGSSISSSFSGRLASYISPHIIDNMVIRKGNISAQYGNTLGSVVDITSLKGSSKYSGFFEGISDNSIGSGFDQNFYTATLSGPLPISKNATFFALAERRYLGDRNPSYITEQSLPNGETKLPNNWQSGWSYHLNSSIPLNSKFELNAFIDISNEEWSEYVHSYYFNIEHTPYHKNEDTLLGAKIAFELDKKTSLSVGYSQFESYRFRGDGKYREDIYAYGRPSGNGTNDVMNLFRSWDDPSTPIVENTIQVDGENRTFVTGGDESRVYDDYFKYKSSYTLIETKVSRKLSNTLKIIAGTQYKKHITKMYHHYRPVRTYLGEANGGFRDLDRYGYDIFGIETDSTDYQNLTKRPKEMAYYFESKIESGNLFLTAGLRYEIFDINSLLLRNPQLPLDPDSLGFDGDPTNDGNNFTLELTDLKNSTSFSYLSPRISLTFLQSENTIVNFSFGKFRKLPNFSESFVGYDFLAYKIAVGGYYVPFGNPSLEPITSTNYEIGLNHRLNENILLAITGYYNSYQGQPIVKNQPSAPTSFATFAGNSKSHSQGAEISVAISPSENISARFEYTYSETRGGSSFSSTGGNVAWVNSNNSFPEFYLDYDQRHSLTGIFNFTYSEQSFFTLSFNYASGLPYSPNEVTNEATLGAFAPNLLDSTNSSRMPSTLNYDLKIEQKIGNSNMILILWIKNLFDRENVTNVWGGTGLPGSTGYAETADGQLFIDGFTTPDRTGLTGTQKYDMAQQHPLNYAPPRQVYLGLRVGF